jgi:hypothetical protein
MLAGKAGFIEALRVGEVLPKVSRLHIVNKICKN